VYVLLFSFSTVSLFAHAHTLFLSLSLSLSLSFRVWHTLRIHTRLSPFAPYLSTRIYAYSHSPAHVLPLSISCSSSLARTRSVSPSHTRIDSMFVCVSCTCLTPVQDSIAWLILKGFFGLPRYTYSLAHAFSLFLFLKITRACALSFSHGVSDCVYLCRYCKLCLRWVRTNVCRWNLSSGSIETRWPWNPKYNLSHVKNLGHLWPKQKHSC